MSFVPYVVEQSAHGERSYDIFSSPQCWELRRLWASPPWGARAACW